MTRVLRKVQEMKAPNEERDPRERTQGAIRRHRRPLAAGGGEVGRGNGGRGREGGSPMLGRCHQRSGAEQGGGNGDGGLAEESGRMRGLSAG